MALTYEECMRRAITKRDTRSEVVRAAGWHHRGDTTARTKSRGASVVERYALQARETAGCARQWEMTAARLLMRRLMNTGTTIDLHHLTVQKALTVRLEET